MEDEVPPPQVTADDDGQPDPCNKRQDQAAGRIYERNKPKAQGPDPQEGQQGRERIEKVEREPPVRLEEADHGSARHIVEKGRQIGKKAQVKGPRPIASDNVVIAEEGDVGSAGAVWAFIEDLCRRR